MTGPHRPKNVLYKFYISFDDVIGGADAANLFLDFFKNRPRAACFYASAELGEELVLVEHRAGVFDLLGLPLLLGPR